MTDLLGTGLKNGIDTPGVASGTGIPASRALTELDSILDGYLKRIDTEENPLTPFLAQQYGQRIAQLDSEIGLKNMSALYFFDAHSKLAASINVLSDNFTLEYTDFEQSEYGIKLKTGEVNALCGVNSYDEINGATNPSFSYGLRITYQKVDPTDSVSICKYFDKNNQDPGIDLLYDPVVGFKFILGGAYTTVNDNRPGMAFLTTVHGGFKTYYDVGATTNESSLMPLPASFNAAGKLSFITANGSDESYDGSIKYYFVGRELTLQQAQAIDAIICNNTLVEEIHK